MEHATEAPRILVGQERRPWLERGVAIYAKACSYYSTSVSQAPVPKSSNGLKNITISLRQNSKH